MGIIVVRVRSAHSPSPRWHSSCRHPWRRPRVEVAGAACARAEAEEVVVVEVVVQEAARAEEPVAQAG